MTKKALIFGITGQDGSYLVEILLNKGYVVHGVIRRSSSFNTGRIDHLVNNPDVNEKTLFLHYGDVTDPLSTSGLITQIQPDEIYNLAAQSHVQVSFQIPAYTAHTDALGTLHIVDAIRNHCPTAKFYQASTSELFGGMGFNMPDSGYTEESPFYPRSPYGVAKLYAYWIVKNYRESYNLFAANGILFNHESSRRGETFVTRKITRWCAKNYKSLKDKKGVIPLSLGNISSKRDWGFAGDYVRAMHLMLQQDKAEDFVVATGETYTVREFIDTCFKWMNLPIMWLGENEQEVGMCEGKVVVKIDPKYYRPSEVNVLLGNPTKAKTILGWEPYYTFASLVDEMLLGDFKKEHLVS